MGVGDHGCLCLGINIWRWEFLLISKRNMLGFRDLGFDSAMGVRDAWWCKELETCTSTCSYVCMCFTTCPYELTTRFTVHCLSSLNNQKSIALLRS